MLIQISFLIILTFNIGSINLSKSYSTEDFKLKLKNYRISIELFDYVSLNKNRLNYNETLLQLELNNTNRAQEIEYNQVFSEIEHLRKALRKTGKYMRDHKYNDINWLKLRQERDQTLKEIGYKLMNKHYQQNEMTPLHRIIRYLYSNHQYEFPVLDYEDSQAKSDCDGSAIDCINEISDKYDKSYLDSLLSSNETQNYYEDSENDHSSQYRLQPFFDTDTRFRYRVTVSYYLCNYTLNRNPLFELFGESCNNLLPIDDTSSIDLRNDKQDFGCAMLSFCPDYCTGHMRVDNRDMTKVAQMLATNECHKMLGLTQCYYLDSGLRRKDPYSSLIRHFDHENKLRDSLKHNFTCQSITHSQCKLSLKRNSNFRHLKHNHVNTTCTCEPHFESHNGLCIDHDECEAREHNCTRRNQICLNTVGSFECICKDGYVMHENNCKKLAHLIEEPKDSKYGHDEFTYLDIKHDINVTSKSNCNLIQLNFYLVLFSKVILLHSTFRH
jgi:hypothetical protein